MFIQYRYLLLFAAPFVGVFMVRLMFWVGLYTGDRIIITTICLIFGGLIGGLTCTEMRSDKGFYIGKRQQD